MQLEDKFKYGEKVIIFLNIFPNTFRTVDEIESWLADSLRAKGLQGTKVQVGNNNRILDIYVRPVDKMLAATYKQVPGRPISVQGKVNQLREHKVSPRERDFKKGKMLVRKGYLKKI